MWLSSSSVRQMFSPSLPPSVHKFWAVEILFFSRFPNVFTFPSSVCLLLPSPSGKEGEDQQECRHPPHPLKTENCFWPLENMPFGTSWTDVDLQVTKAISKVNKKISRNSVCKKWDDNRYQMLTIAMKTVMMVRIVDLNVDTPLSSSLLLVTTFSVST